MCQDLGDGGLVGPCEQETKELGNLFSVVFNIMISALAHSQDCYKSSYHRQVIATMVM